MRRIVITVLIFVLCAALYSCAAERNSSSALPESGTPEVHSDVISEATAESDGAAGQAEILNECLERFGADRYWQDAFIDFKYFLLNGSELVCLLAIPNAEQTTVVPLSSVSRVEQTKTGAFTVVTVYDRSGGSVSINLDGDKAAELVKKIG